MTIIRRDVELRPLDPIFQPRIRRGAIDVGNTPGTPPVPSTISDAIMSLNPLGYWKLDDTSGTTAVDSSGGGRNGTYGGTGYNLATTAGPDGGSYATFPGSTQTGHVSVADANDWSMNTHSGLTIFALATGGSASGSRYLGLKSGFNQSEWGMGRFSGVMRGRIWRPNGDIIASVTSPALSGTGWYAFAWTVPATPVTDIATKWFYNSPTENGSPTTGNTAGIYANGTAPMRIGGSSGTSQSWGGAIAHFAIFSPLSDSDVDMLMTVADNEGWF